MIDGPRLCRREKPNSEAYRKQTEACRASGIWPYDALVKDFAGYVWVARAHARDGGRCWGMEPGDQGPTNRRENDLRCSPPSVQLRLIKFSERKSSALSTLGQDLRNARRSEGLEISHISSRLKISKRHLNAIEESNLEALPLAEVYLIGYTRDYAKYLGLNSTQCLEKPKNEIAERKFSGQAKVAHPQKHRLPIAG